MYLSSEYKFLGIPELNVIRSVVLSQRFGYLQWPTRILANVLENAVKLYSIKIPQ